MDWYSHWLIIFSFSLAVLSYFQKDLLILKFILIASTALIIIFATAVSEEIIIDIVIYNGICIFILIIEFIALVKTRMLRLNAETEQIFSKYFIKYISKEVFKKFYHRSHIRTIRHNELLIEEGEAQDSIYFILLLSGDSKIQVVKKNSVILNKIEGQWIYQLHLKDYLEEKKAEGPIWDVSMKIIATQNSPVKLIEWSFEDLKDLLEDYEYGPIIRNALFSLMFTDMTYIILKFNDCVAKKLVAHDENLEREIKQISKEAFVEEKYEIKQEEIKIQFPQDDQIANIHDNPFQRIPLTEKELTNNKN